ncbi:MAG: hypothetical protein WAV92_10400 [Halopseudomonas yangmingensis]|uniref:Uncharacterized protein n=1 Tax=Halopseudomonas yangmingensis TaxID=1720063 RepID=A0A1I4UC77_9GAMM|nr:hypothetical protein [Halopseudomonas yangmingensis]SFM86441.1 hypothetical protein SAMN05216217_1209 [Halopseudomonas yangmingensis]
MTFLDSAFDFAGNTIDAVGSIASNTAAKAVTLGRSTLHTVKENPGKIALVCAATIATGGAAAAFAGPIAATIGSTGLLGATASGTAISTLKGAALVKASLAALGGGSLAAGGGGMAAGATVVTVSGATLGASVSTGAAVGVSRIQK